MRILFAALLALAVACGGPLNPAFGGSWAGTSIVTPGGQSYAATVAVVVSASGDSATVSGVCPGGQDSNTFQGSADAMEKPGLLCLPAQLGSCSTARLTFTSATLTLYEAAPGDWRMAFGGQGTLSGCGPDGAVAVSLVADR